jgi:GNAT superfamily N-acetyltransferase
MSHANLKAAIEDFVVPVTKELNISLSEVVILDHFYPYLIKDGAGVYYEYNRLDSSSRGFSFTMSDLPGCCGICVSSDVSVWGSFKGKGLGQKLLQVRIDAAKSAGYSRMLATTLTGNETEIHILEKFGFLEIDAFDNQRTGHSIRVWSKAL